MSVLPPSVRPSVNACVQRLAPIPAVVSQNVTYKSCMVSVMSENYAFWVTLRPQSDRSKNTGAWKGRRKRFFVDPYPVKLAKNGTNII